MSAAGWSVNCSASCSSSGRSSSPGMETERCPELLERAEGRKQQPSSGATTTEICHLCTVLFWCLFSHTLFFLMEMDEWTYRSHSCVSARSGRLLFPQLGINRCGWQHTREQRNNPALTPPTRAKPMWPECLITATNSRWLS